METFFATVIRLRVFVIVVGLIGISLAASQVPDLHRDTSADAFIPADNPARLYRDEIKEVFGLADPIIVAVMQDGDEGVFTPEALQLVESLTYAVQDIENIDPDRVYSLATENNIRGIEGGIEVTRFFDNYPDNVAAAQEIWRQIEDFPLYLGTMVANDGTGTLIIAEVLDEASTEGAYIAIEELVSSIERPQGVEIHIAGEAAVTGYLGSYIDSDAQRLNPMAGVVITLVLFLAFRTLAGAFLPNVIVAATVAGTLGFMAFAGVSFFVITNAMPVVLIGIAVADSIHIFSEYYQKLRDDPDASNNDAVLHAMHEMARPITLTTLTTIAGFMGLYFGSVQPPMQYMGLFTAYGVFLAWLYSLTVLPAAMSYLKPGRSSAMVYRSELAGWMMIRLGQTVLNRPRIVVVTGALVVAGGIAGALNVVVDDRRLETFHGNEPIVLADEKINRHFYGTGVFDIVVETDHPEALFRPDYLGKIEDFQREIETHEIVGGTTSVVDYLKQLNRSLNEGRPEEYRLVDDRELNAQLFLLYSASADPTDFEEEIDYDYQRANIRVNLKNNGYVEVRPVIADLRRYIET